MQIMGKDIQVIVTQGVLADYPEGDPLYATGMEALEKHKCDMLVFEEHDGKFQVRSAGYLLVKVPELDEESKFYMKDATPPKQRIWLKVDDYGAHYVATFLYPGEY